MDEKTIKNFRAGIAAIRGARDECETVAEYEYHQRRNEPRIAVHF